MVEKVIYISFFLFSLYSYCTAPIKFSPNYCLVQFWVYLIIAVVAILMNKRRYDTFFNASSIFLILFMMATYLHSIYYYKNEKILASFAFGYNLNIVNRAICMAQIGISSYLIGTSLVRYHVKNKFIKNTGWITNAVCKIFQNISLILSSVWFVYIFVFFKRSRTYVIVYPRLTLLLTSVLLFALLLAVMYDCNHRFIRVRLTHFIIRNRRLLFAFILFLAPFFYLNSRTIPAAIALVIIMIVHSYYKKLSFSFFVLFGFVAFVLMAIVSYSRISDVNTSNATVFDILVVGFDFLLKNEHATTFLLQDYMLNIRNLYDGLEYPSTHDYLYGMTYVPIFFSAIPFLPSLILNLLGYQLEDVDTSNILTGYNGSNYGLGTHIIGDLYMNGGLVYVIVSMVILGYIVTKSDYRKSFCWLLVSCSIYGSIMMLPRINFLNWFVMLSLLFTMYIITRLFLTNYSKVVLRNEERGQFIFRSLVRRYVSMKRNI